VTKGVKICLAAVIVIFVISAALSVIFLTSTRGDTGDDPVWVEIVSGNEVLYKLDLSDEEDRTFRIDCGSGWNDITIKDHRISITDADCPDHTCVKTGELRYDYLPIICLPHNLIVRFCEGE
jgi:hypothetical protein